MENEAGDGDKSHDTFYNKSMDIDGQIRKSSQDPKDRQSTKSSIRKSTYTSFRHIRSSKALIQIAKPPPRLFQNTYQMYSKMPMKLEIVNNLMKQTITKVMSLPEYNVYNHIKTPRIQIELAADMRNRIRQLFYDRIRIIVIVTIVEKFELCCAQKIGFLWGAEEDNWTTTEFYTDTYFLSATCFGVYSE